MKANLRFLVCLLLAGAALALPAAALAQTAAVSVFPIAGSMTALPATQIVFRGIPAVEIGTIKVAGSHTGVHTGAIEPDSDGDGGSFVPTKPFSPNELVTVTTDLDVIGGQSGSFHFRIAHPTRPLTSAALPVVPAGRDGVRHFHSRPDLMPPSITVTKDTAPAGIGDIFLAPQFGPVQDGPMLLDGHGNLIWFDPTSLSSRLLTTDFRVQQLGGQPVLTWWQGYTNHGTGQGEGMILNSQYRQIGVVKAGDGLRMDLHEFFVTPQGDAYFIAVSPVWWHGVKRPVLDSVVQEVDIKTGLVLFEWHALDHIPLAQSYFGPPKSVGHILDPFHINSVSLDSDGNVIISARDTYTVYKIDHATGAIIWQLGGKKSSFKMGPGTMTAMQHDAIAQPDATITAFDDGAGPPLVHSQSRAVRIAIDTTDMTARLVTQFTHSPPLSADFEGSAQALPGGDTFVGWGQQPYFSEFTPTGKLDFDAHFTVPTTSYRAYRLPWSGQPATLPAVATAARHRTTTVYASWNGATDVYFWRTLAGPSPTRLAPLGTAARHGFETAIQIPGVRRYVAVQALGANRRVLAQSKAVAAR